MERGYQRRVRLFIRARYMGSFRTSTTSAKALKGRWVLKTMRKPNGDPYRYKARHVLQGFSQRKGYDYNETYAPVANQTSLRLLLTVAANKELTLVQMNVKTAFLHGPIDIDDIFVCHAEGFIELGKENLLKSQYNMVYYVKQVEYGIRHSKLLCSNVA